MNTKTILTMTIMLVLPISANATYTYNYVMVPRVPVNGTVTMPTGFGGLFQIASIGEDDDEHIASTAYVKGAYNDTVAMVNLLEEQKQGKLANVDTEEGIAEVYGVAGMFDMIVEGTISDASDVLLSADAIMAGIQSQRVEIYTTWDDDDATTDVAFKTVVPED